MHSHEVTRSCGNSPLPRLSYLIEVGSAAVRESGARIRQTMLSAVVLGIKQPINEKTLVSALADGDEDALLDDGVVKLVAERSRQALLQCVDEAVVFETGTRRTAQIEITL